MTLPGLALGLVFSLLVPVNDLASQFLPGMVNLPFSGEVSARLLSLLDSLLGAAVGAAFIYGAGAVYLRWRGMEGMGFGDVKLMAMVGAFLGMKLTVFTIFTASLAGSLFGSDDSSRGLDQAHAPLHEAAGQCASGAAARDGNRRKWSIAITRCRLASFWEAWRCSRSFSATASCTGTEGSGENPGQPGVAASGDRAVSARRSLFCWDCSSCACCAKILPRRADLSAEASPSLETLPLHLYNTVIQQLKQQKHELQVQSQAEQHRARTSETFSQAVLSNLSCGVLVFGTNGLVKTSNPSAKAILGFASTTGMGAEDIFRGAVVSSAKPAATGVPPDENSTDENSDEPVSLADEVSAVLREDSKRREVEAEYETPAGKSASSRSRFLRCRQSMAACSAPPA